MQINWIWPALWASPCGKWLLLRVHRNFTQCSFDECDLPFQVHEAQFRDSNPALYHRKHLWKILVMRMVHVMDPSHNNQQIHIGRVGLRCPTPSLYIAFNNGANPNLLIWRGYPPDAFYYRHKYQDYNKCLMTYAIDIHVVCTSFPLPIANSALAMKTW